MGDSRDFLTIITLLATFQSLQASLVIDIQLVSYRDDCWEDEFPFYDGSACDPMLRFCVDRPTSRVTFSKSSCEYSYVDWSGYFQDSNSINFQKIRDKKGIPIPWIIEVDKITDSSILMAVEVDDHDNLSNDDMKTIVDTLPVEISPSKEKTTYKRHFLKERNYIITLFLGIYCQPHYYSSDCQVHCKAQNNYNGHYTCHPETGAKMCIKGWTGENCDIDINECDLRFCRSGRCENLPGDYNCICPDYFTGRNCTTMSNPCGNNPCHGSSICQGDSVSFTYTCLCLPGWEGFDCGVKSDPCEENPCLHGGECTSSDDNFSFTCSCPDIWEGKTCEKWVDPCASSPCKNGGHCDGDFGTSTFTCLCPSGWLGERCTTKFEPCTKKPCHNGAQCDENMDTHSYQCHCVPGWEGEHCENKTNPCLLDPCQHNGTCNSSEDFYDYNCSCPYGWEGQDCHRRLDPCFSNPCLHGGHCRGNREDLTYNCSCSRGFYGKNCENKSEPCKSHPCQHGGQCVENLDTYNCSCTIHWEGVNCQERINPCVLTPCLNNGTCQSRNENFDHHCSCPHGFEGDHCQYELDDESPVLQNATQAQTSSEDWKVPLSVTVAVVVTSLLIVIFIFVVYWRQRKSKKLKYVTDTLPVVVYETRGNENLAFENQAYSQVNRANQQIELGRDGQEFPPAPTTSSDDDIFNPVKPSFSVDDECPGAVGGACGTDDRSAKKDVLKHLEDESEDRKYSRISTLSQRPASERAEENPYQDFKSLAPREPKKEENIEDEIPEMPEEEEDHYQVLEDVIDSVRNSHFDDTQDVPPELPPFNFGVQRNPLQQLPNDINLDSDISDVDDTPSVSHYQEPDESAISPDDIYADVDKTRYEEATLPRRTNHLPSEISDDDDESENDARLSSASSRSHYDVPTGAGPKSDSVMNDSHVYDNPRESIEPPYDVPRHALDESKDDVGDLFSNNDPWTPDPFNASATTNSPPNQNNTHVYNNNTDDDGDDLSEEEPQEDIAQLQQEVKDFMEQLKDADKENTDYSTA